MPACPAIATLARGLAAWILAAAAAACGGGGTAHPPNLLLLTLDTTRADHLGSYGSPRARTPNLDRLATRGVSFETVYTPTPLTLPSHASIMTGTFPARHGLRQNAGGALAGECTTLAERLHAAGYDTAAFVSSFVLDSRFGLDDGFDSYGDELPAGPRGGEGPERTAAQVVGAAASWLRSRSSDRRRQAPFFLWVHFYDPHTPYLPPPPYDGEPYHGQPYDGEIAYMDAQIGRLLALVGRLSTRRPLLVAVVGDHGEGLGEDDEATHGILVHEATVRVPMIWAGAGVHGGRSAVVASPVRLVDVLPTALDLLLAAVPSSADGVSLRDAIGGGGTGAPRDLPCPLESDYPWLHYRWAPVAGIRRGHWKLVVSAREELYDLGRDPAGRRDRIDERPAVAAALRAELARLREPAGPLHPPRPLALGGADRRRLEALGYVPPPPPPPTAPRRDALPAMERWGALPDPAARVASVGLLEEAAGATRRGDFDGATRLFEKALEIDPGSARARSGLGVMRLRRGEASAALPLLEKAVALDPELATAHANLGAALDALGRREEAARSYARALALDPTQEGAARNLGLLRLQGGEYRAALEAFRLQDGITPARPDTIALMARCEEALGDRTAALAHLERAAALAPRNRGLWAELARVARAAGRRDLERRARERLAALGARRRGR